MSGTWRKVGRRLGWLVPDAASVWWRGSADRCFKLPVAFFAGLFLFSLRSGGVSSAVRGCVVQTLAFWLSLMLLSASGLLTVWCCDGASVCAAVSVGTLACGAALLSLSDVG